MATMGCHQSGKKESLADGNPEKARLSCIGQFEGAVAVVN